MARVKKETKLALEVAPGLNPSDYKTEEEALAALAALENKQENETDNSKNAALADVEGQEVLENEQNVEVVQLLEDGEGSEAESDQDLDSIADGNIDLVQLFMDATGVERENAAKYVEPAQAQTEGVADKVATDTATKVSEYILSTKGEQILASKLEKITDKMKPAVREAAFSALDDLSRELGGGVHILEKFLEERTRSYQRHITELRQSDGSTIEIDSHDGKLWHYQAPLIDFLVRMHGLKVNMFGTSGIGKTHLVAMLSEMWGAELFFMAGSKEISTAHFFGVYDANSNFQETPVTLWAKFPDGRAVLILDEADRVLGDSFISLNSLLENDLVYNQFRVDGREYFDNLVNPSEKFVIITSNTDMTGGNKKYTQANKQDRAAVNRYVGVQMMNDYYMQRKLAGMPTPERDCVWASFSDALEVSRQIADGKSNAIEVAYNSIERMCQFINGETGDSQKAKEYRTYDVTPSHAKRAVKLMRDGVPWDAVSVMTWGYGIPKNIRDSLLQDAGINKSALNELESYQAALSSGTGPWAEYNYWSWAKNV